MDKKCPHCNRPIPKGSSFCMYCFKNINRLKTPDICKTKRSVKRPLALIACITAIVIAVSTITVFANREHIFESTTVSTSAQTTVTTEASALTTSVDKQTTSTTAKPTTKASTTTTTKVEQTSSASTENDDDEIISKSNVTAKQTTRRNKITTTKSNKVVIESGVLKKYPSSKSSKSYAIPYNVKKINDNAFEVNTNLTSLKFSKRENLTCNWDKLFSSLPNLRTIYIYPGTSVDTTGMQYFDGEIVYYYD